MPLGDLMKKIYKCILFLILVLVIFIATSTIVIANIKTDNIIVYIDPGHGGFDGGATSNDKLVIEKDITLQISNYLKEYLERTNIVVLMTRNKDEALAKTKRDDILKRVSLINKSDCDIYISLHANAYSSSMVKGAQTFYNKQNSKNKDLATKILKHIKLLDTNNKRETKEISGKYLLDNVSKVGCLVEIGFLTNQEELNKIKSDIYLENMAFMIYLGILDYLEENTYGTINVKN